ncbi:MAG TPA: carbonic anhydrase family protein, partial [Nitrosospira sp.]|nr:carbonic anhydrase family protein [Nitrosospira sp.]
RANLDDPSASTLSVNGDTYTLSQFHFHAPAEHLENGYKYPMEMHLVFQDANKHLLVVGRWVQEGSFNQTLDPIFSHIPQDTSTTLTIDHFNLNALLPDHLNSFRYDGSLTTPKFDEGVKWVDLSTPMDMSKEQINAFSSLFPNGDAREVQALNGRIVQTDLPGFTVTSVPEPETYAMMLVGLGLIGFIANRRRRMNSLQSGVLPAAV